MRSTSLLLILLAACGRVTSESPDGGGDPPDADGLPDAGSPDADLTPDAAAFGPVDVTFYYGTPYANAKIFVYDPAGAYLFEEATGANGRKVVENVPRGGSITVGDFIGGAPRMRSIYGLAPGDVISVGERSPPSDTTALAASSALGGVDHYVIGAGCGLSSGTIGNFNAYNRCKTGTGWTVVALAYTNATTLGSFKVVKDFPSGQTVALGGTWQPAFEMAEFILGWSNVLPGTTSTRLELLHGWPMSTVSFVDTAATSGSVSFRYAPGAEATIRYQVVATLPAGAQSAFVREITPIRMESVNQQLLMFPAVASVTGDFTNGPRPTISWTLAGDMTGADMIKIKSFWDGTGFYDWEVYLPANGQTSFQFPPIPTAYVQLQPPSGAGWFFDTTVTYVDAADLAYDAVRPDPDRFFNGRTSNKSFHKDSPL